MIVAVSEPELEYTGRFGWINDEGEGWDFSDDTFKLSSVRFNIKASADSAYHVSMNRYSFGRTEDEAINRADKIQYSVYSRDSVLDLANGYAVDKDSKFRGQQVEIEILVPVGKKIRFDESVNNKLNPYNIRVKRSYRRNRVVDIDFDDDYWHRFRSGVDYEMGIDGSLKELGVSSYKNKSGEYRYDENDSILIQQEIERKKQELKELEELKKEKVKPASINEERMDSKDEDEAFTTSFSPVFSLVRYF